MLPYSMERAKDSLEYGTKMGNLYSMIHFLHKNYSGKGIHRSKRIKVRMKEGG